MTLSYCGEMVRKHDPDRFLLSMFSAPARREALWALYAFNHEIAKTREVVTETQLGLIRLQWWRDSIGALYEGKPAPKHQILEPLAAAIGQHRLPQELFDSLVFAREFDLEDRLPATMEGMANYADFTSGPLLKLSLLVEGKGAAEPAIRAAGIAYALTGLLRALPAHLGQRRCYVPESLLHEADVSEYELYDGKNLDRLQKPVSAIAGEARRQIAAAEGEPALHRHLRLAAIHLNRIEKCGWDVFAPALRHPPPFLMLRLMRG